MSGWEVYAVAWVVWMVLVAVWPHRDRVDEVER